MKRRGGLTAIDGAMALIALLLVVQMWLLTATLEAYLSGHSEPIFPAALISGLIFVGCFGLFLFIRRIDANVRNRLYFGGYSQRENKLLTARKKGVESDADRG